MKTNTLEKIYPTKLRSRLSGMKLPMSFLGLWICLSTLVFAAQVRKGFLTFENSGNWRLEPSSTSQMLVFVSGSGVTLTLDNMGYDIKTHESARDYTKGQPRFLPKDYTIQGSIVEKTLTVDGRAVPVLSGKATSKNKPDLEWQMYFLPNYRYMGSFEEPSETLELASFHAPSLQKNEIEIKEFLNSIRVSKADAFRKTTHSHESRVTFEAPDHWIKVPERDYDQFRLVSAYAGYLRTSFFDKTNVAQATKLIMNGYFSALFKNGIFKTSREYKFKTAAGAQLHIFEGYGEEIQFTMGGSYNSLSFALLETPQGTFCLIFFGSLDGGKPVYENILKSIRYAGR